MPYGTLSLGFLSVSQEETDRLYNDMQSLWTDLAGRGADVRFPKEMEEARIRIGQSTQVSPDYPISVKFSIMKGTYDRVMALLRPIRDKMGGGTTYVEQPPGSNLIFIPPGDGGAPRQNGQEWWRNLGFESQTTALLVLGGGTAAIALLLARR